MGRLKIAINVKLLLDFEAIAETIVNNEEKPKLPSKRVTKKSGKSCIKLPTKRVYTIKHNVDKRESNKEL